MKLIFGSIILIIKLKVLLNIKLDLQGSIPISNPYLIRNTKLTQCKVKKKKVTPTQAILLYESFDPTGLETRGHQILNIVHPHQLIIKDSIVPPSIALQQCTLYKFLHLYIYNNIRMHFLRKTKRGK